MRKVEIDTWEDNIGHIWWEIIDGVQISGTATSDPMALSLSPTEERPRKKRPSNHVGCRIAKAATVSLPAVSDIVLYRRTAAAVTAGSCHV